MKYRVLAALRADMNEGWVWVTSIPSFLPRSIIKITNKDSGKSVYCEYLEIDENFRTEYNGKPSTSKLEDNGNVAIINSWYRKKTSIDKTGEEIRMRIIKANNPCGQFRACTDHPQVVVRLATWLALIGIILGVFSITPAVYSSLKASVNYLCKITQ